MISQEFYFLECYGIHPIASIGQSPDVKGSWESGHAVLKPVDVPLRYSLDLKPVFDADSEVFADSEVLEGMDLANVGADDFNIKPLMTSQKPPLIRNDMLDVLCQSGADNIEVFKAEILNPISGRVHNNFSAFNVVGIANEDWARDLRRTISQRDYRVNKPPYLIFRLFEEGPLVVHHAIKVALEHGEFEGLDFTPTYENY